MRDGGIVRGVNALQRICGGERTDSRRNAWSICGRPTHRRWAIKAPPLASQTAMDLSDQSADGHEARITARCRRVDAQRALDHQAFQGNAGFAFGQAVHADNRAATLGNLLADGA